MRMMDPQRGGYGVLARSAVLVASFFVTWSAGQMQMDKAAPVQPPLTGCFQDPTNGSCGSFALSDANAVAELKDLCVTTGVSMPYMVVCSLLAECQVCLVNNASPHASRRAIMKPLYTSTTNARMHASDRAVYGDWKQ